MVYGASGSGKSTLLRLIAGLERPAYGEISLKGEIVSTAQAVLPSYKRNCSMIFQQLALWPHMTVIEHLLFGIRPYEKKRITELFIQFELEVIEAVRRAALIEQTPLVGDGRAHRRRYNRDVHRI